MGNATFQTQNILFLQLELSKYSVSRFEFGFGLALG